MGYEDPPAENIRRILRGSHKGEDPVMEVGKEDARKIPNLTVEDWDRCSSMRCGHELGETVFVYKDLPSLYKGRTLREKPGGAFHSRECAERDLFGHYEGAAMSVM